MSFVLSYEMAYTTRTILQNLLIQKSETAAQYIFIIASSCLRSVGSTTPPLAICSLTHLSMAPLLWDIGKQNSPGCDAAERGVPSGAILFA